VSEQRKQWDAVSEQMHKTFAEADRAFKMADEAFESERHRAHVSSSPLTEQTFRFTASTWRQRAKLAWKCGSWALRALFDGEVTISLISKRK
jgi:hypothetical protein